MKKLIAILILMPVFLAVLSGVYHGPGSVKIVTVAAVSVPSDESAPATTGDSVTLSVHADKTEVNPKDTVKLTVTLTTNAPLDKPSKLIIYVNEKVVKEMSLSPLEAGVTLNYEFDFTPEAPGYYVIQVVLVKQAGVVG